MRLAEHVDPAGVGAGLGEHRTGHQVDVARARSGRYSGGTTWRAEEGGLVGHLAGEAQQPGLVGHVEPVAALDLHRRRALRAHLGDPVRAAAGAARRRRPRGWRRPCWRSRRRRRRRRSSARRTPRCGRRRRPGACGCRRSRGRRRGRPGRGAGRRAGGVAAWPTQSTRSSGPSTRAASWSVPSPSSRPGGPVQVTSSPMPVTRVVVAVTVRPAARRTRRGTAGPPGRVAVLAAVDDHLAAHDDGRHVGRRRRVGDLAGPAARGAERVGRGRRRSRRARPRRGCRRRTSRGCGSRSRWPRGPARRAGTGPARSRQPLVHLEAAQLLERVDDGVLVGAEAEG